MSTKAVENITIHLDEPHVPTGGSLPPKPNYLLRWVLFGVSAGLVVLAVLLGLIQKWLWMKELNYVGIFWTLLSVKWVMFGAALVFGLLYLWTNLRFAATSIDLSQERARPMSAPVQKSP